MKRILFVLILLSPFSPSFAERIPIAVLDLDAKGVGLEKGVADVLTESVRYEFGETKDFDVVAREKMNQLAKEKAIQLSGCTEISCAVRIGKALNVKKMVVGSLGKLGQKYLLFLRVVDVEKENVECNAKREGEVKVEELPTLVPYAVKRLSACLTGQPLPPDSAVTETHGAIAFKVVGLSKSKDLEDMIKDIQGKLAGIEAMRIKSLEGDQAVLEIETKKGYQTLAGELGAADFKNFKIQVTSTADNEISASVARKRKK